MSAQSSSSTTSAAKKAPRWVAVILARGGSKGIPNKNIKEIAGKPLIAWSIDAALSSGIFNEVWVSTDSDEIEVVAARYGAAVHRRAAVTATDEASSELGLLEFAFAHPYFDVLSLIQCTSPLTTTRDYEKAREDFEYKMHADSLLTVHTEVKFLWQPRGEVLYDYDETHSDDQPEFAIASNYDPQFRPRRQEAQKQRLFVENGAFYFTTKEALFSRRCRIGERPILYVMAAENAVDIDTELDMIVAETVLNERIARKKRHDENVVKNRSRFTAR